MKKNNARTYKCIALIGQLSLILICCLCNAGILNTLTLFISVSLLFALSLTILAAMNPDMNEKEKANFEEN